MKSHLQQTILGIVSFAAAWADEIAAPRGALMIIIFRDGERRSATARHEEHTQRLLLFFILLSGFGSRFHDSSTVANDFFLR